jgi:hypothetical protein
LWRIEARKPAMEADPGCDGVALARCIKRFEEIKIHQLMEGTEFEEAQRIPPLETIESCQLTGRQSFQKSRIGRGIPWRYKLKR